MMGMVKRILLSALVAVVIFSTAPCMLNTVYGKSKKQTANQAAAYPSASAVSSEVMHAYVRSIITQITTPEMTNDQKLAASYLYVLDHMKYKRSTAAGDGKLVKDYALEAFFTGQGNCYRYASMFAYMASELGYNAAIHSGECTSSHGGMTPHSWVVISHPDGRVLIYDGSFGDSAKGSKNYFGITADQHSRQLVTKEIWEVIF